MNQIGFIGAGKMAQALGAGMAQADRQLRFVISDPSPESQQAFRSRIGTERTSVVPTNQDVLDQCDIVFLAVKPQVFDQALEGVVARDDRSPLIVSVMAGIRSERITARMGNPRMIRVMPNTPCLIGHGVCAVAPTGGASQEDVTAVIRLLEPVGRVVQVEETQLDGVTGVSGSGPAYVFLFIESLIRGGVEVGLPEAMAQTLAIETVLGAAMLAKESTDPLSVLRDRVTSPGGTTLAGLDALRDHQFDQAVVAAVKSAYDRSKELGAE